MKKYLLMSGVLFFNTGVFACEACKKQQPKFLRGVAHGPGPGSDWDYLIVAVMVGITLYFLAATAKCVIKPAENEQQHIKRLILNDWRL